MVLSPIACGTLNSVDWSEAMKEPGVRAYIDHHDVRDGVMLGHTHDTPIFVKDKVRERPKIRYCNHLLHRKKFWLSILQRWHVLG